MIRLPLSEKRTFVIGASSNPERYAFQACKMLKQHKVPFVAIGLKKDVMEDGTAIQTIESYSGKAHTITMYVGAPRQKTYYDFILASQPKRIIFNPGAENPELERMATEIGIEVIHACTLVMLATGQY